MTASAQAVQLVWFKRDLRTTDHRPLAHASRRGPLLCVYVYEPEHVTSAEFDASHLDFINECLDELDTELRALGGRLTRRVGDVPDVFAQLVGELAPGRHLEAIWSHEETGLDWSYARDRRVAAWCRDRGVAWHETPTNGVVRRLRTRDGWARRWLQRMSEPVTPPPTDATRWACDAVADHGERQDAVDLGLSASTRTDVQRGGMRAARDVLDSFLSKRGVDYRAKLSSPLTGWDACSRLSPYLAWGALSMREVYQHTRRRVARLRADPQRVPGWLDSLKSFEERLRWHCHFVQKLEDEPELEFRNLNRAYDGLREDRFDPERFAAWSEGRTGYPFVDACMRSLHATGWTNFRMRAMLVSFACHHLWLHWRQPAVFLARHFLDFEPGIHFSQFQMQAGTAGINTTRIYSPAKQLRDQDPDGAFTRRWVPELRDVPLEHLAEPHRMSHDEQRRAACTIGADYPAPIVDHATAYAAARRRLAAVKGSPEARVEAFRVFERHGSRRSPRQRSWRSTR